MTTIKLRRGSAADWTLKNPVLAQGEPGFESDSGLLKIGSGALAWNELSYFQPASVKAAAAPTEEYFTQRRIVLLEDFGGAFDRRSATFSTSGGSSIISSGDAEFTSADVGRYIVVPGAGGEKYAGQLISQIKSVNSAAQAEVTGTATASVGGQAGFIGTSNDKAWHAAFDTLRGTGGTILLPAGRGMHMLQKEVPSDVRVIGAGMDVTFVHPVGIVNGFYRATTQGDTSTPPTNIHWRDLTVDGSMQTHRAKGWYMNHMIQCTWTDVKCVNTGASGFGVDYLQDCWFTRCWAENCGRLGDLFSPGCSGFGIGTGVWERENTYLIDCVSRGNKRHGAFFENQPSALRPAGAQVVGGRYEGNGLTGISDQNVTGLIVLGAHLVGNRAQGFSVTTTSALHNIAIDGQISQCVITDNAADGVDLDWTHDPLPVTGHYRVVDNLIKGNGGRGVSLRAAPRYRVGLVDVRDNVIESNAYNGIRLNGGRFVNSRLIGNVIVDNGTKGTGSRTSSGIAIEADLENCDLVGNYITDTRPKKSKTQTVGILLSETAPSISFRGGRIAHNELRGNAAKALVGLRRIIGPGARVQDNPGLNPLGNGKVQRKKSPAKYQCGVSAETHYLSGDITKVKINGMVVHRGRAGTGLITVSLDPGDKMVVAFTGQPTWKRQQH